jgi:hypothetical protein
MRHFIFLLFFICSCSSPSKINPVKYVHQSTNVWCWAAGVSMAVQYVYGIEEKDCNIVHLETGKDCCGLPEQCNYKATIPEIEDLLRLYNIEYKSVFNDLSFENIEQIINTNGIIMMFVKYDGDKKHLIIINGYNKKYNTLYIIDPLNGLGEMDYEKRVISGDKVKWLYSIVITK